MSNFKYNINDIVVVRIRKNNGHPRSLKDGVSYVVYKVLGDGHLLVREKMGSGFSQTKKVHEKYLTTISQLREFKINQILS